VALEGSHPPFYARDLQRREALAVANAKRVRKARLKKLLKKRELDVVDTLEGKHPEWDEAVGIMKIEELLRCIPRVGKLTTQEIADELHVSLHMRVRHMDEHLRADMARILRLLRGDNLA
jgi:hypothetical protein